jgi:hypothetical protein
MKLSCLAGSAGQRVDEAAQDGLSESGRRLEPVRSAPGTCAHCGGRGQAGANLLPYFTGLGARGACHVWLHSGGCASAWHDTWRSTSVPH